MTWDRLSALADIISAVAVVISLIYLAIQVRSGARSLRTTLRDSAFHSLSEWNFHIMSEPDLAHIFQQGCQDIETLNERERARFVHVMYSFYKMFENIYLHFFEGSVGGEAWDSNKMILVAYSPLPGAQAYWRQRGAVFEPRFRQLVDGLGKSEIFSGAEIALGRKT